MRTKPRKTVDDYLKLPEGTRAELIEGEIYMSPAPKFAHQKVVSNLHLALWEFVRPRNLGEVVLSPMDVHLPTGDIVQPDVLFIAEANRAIIQDWIRGVPDLVIEVLSPESAERDRITKRTLFERSGVKEYWILDLDEASVEVLTLAGGRLESSGYFRGADGVESKVLVGIGLPAARVFA